MAKILRNYLKSDRLLDQEVYVAERRRADSQRNDAVAYRNRFVPTKKVHFQVGKNSKSVVVEIDDRGNGFEQHCAYSRCAQGVAVTASN
jgi:hypothetical protein